MLFSFEDLRVAFQSHVLENGRDCLESGRVASPDVQRNGELITSLIQGVGKHPHRVYVRTQAGVESDVLIRGECSCGQRNNCQHVAAVLLKALADEQELDGEALDLEQLSRLPAAPSADYPPTVRQRLLYQLFPGADNSSGMEVVTVGARCLPEGGYGSSRVYEPGWASSGRPPRFLLAVDRELLVELDRLEPDRETGRRPLEGRSGAHLLGRMLQTQRCFLESSEIECRPGPLRHASLQWEMDEQGNQFPLVRADSPAVRVFLLDSPWYVDPSSRECGQLETGLPAALPGMLIDLQPLAPDQVDAMQATLARRFPGGSLPPLRRLALEQRGLLRPVPCLHLTTQEEQGLWPVETDGALLSFDYLGVRLSGQQAPQVLQGDTVVRFERDAEFEQECAERLLEAGLKWNDRWPLAAEGDSFILSDTAGDWYDFQIHELPRLRDQGWRIGFNTGFRHRLAEVEQWYGELEPEDGNGWFSLGLGVQLEGERINLLPALVGLLQEFPKVFRRQQLREMDPERHLIVLLDDGRRVPVPLGRIRHILETLFELYQVDALNADERLRLSRIQLARLAELDELAGQTPMHWLGSSELRDLAERLRGIDGIPAVAAPAGLKTTLRDYQQHGLAWLQFLREYELAGLLADDMGLGKTVQALAHLLLEKEQGRADRPSLVVAPTSLMGNWRREAHQFTPDLRVLTLHGSRRREQFAAIANHDLVLTTYPLLVRDRQALLAHDYHLLILDEAQIIKNPGAQASRMVRELRARQRLCLTGTPMENHLGELWSLFDFLLPGLLGDARQFRRVFRNPVEKAGDTTVAAQLARRVRPFLLRRTKEAVVRELPPKTEIVRSVELEGMQRDLYESIRLAMHQRVRREVAEKGLARSQIVILDALLKLRQVCCDPRLVKLESARKVQHSAKLEMLLELLPGMLEEGRRVLLFSQFTGMLKLIEARVKEAGVDYVKLTGQTRDRTTPVARFQCAEVPLFLISLKAGGLGLNLTAADTVIHYDPWWNPAVERQATDRAHRIGQENPVFVYKLIAEGTVEEKIQSLQARKQALADSLFERKEGGGVQWTAADLEALFEPLE